MYHKLIHFYQKHGVEFSWAVLVRGTRMVHSLSVFVCSNLRTSFHCGKCGEERTLHFSYNTFRYNKSYLTTNKKRKRVLRVLASTPVFYRGVDFATAVEDYRGILTISPAAHRNSSYPRRTETAVIHETLTVSFLQGLHGWVIRSAAGETVYTARCDRGGKGNTLRPLKPRLFTWLEWQYKQ